MNWQQYSKRRRGMSLEDFLVGCSSKQDAIAIFVKRKIEPPMDLLEKFYATPTPTVTNTTVPQEVATAKNTKVVSSGTETN